MEQGWQFETRDNTVRAQNTIEKHRICTVVLNRKNEQEQDTYNRVFNEIDKHYKSDNPLWHSHQIYP